MITWHTAGAEKTEVVESFPDVEAALAELASSSWEEPTNRWISYLTDERGEAVAVAIFGPARELLVAVSDGRQLAFAMPEFYSKPAGITEE